MPIYTYICNQCYRKAEVFRKIAQRYEAPICCGAAMEFRIVPTMIQADIDAYVSVAIDKKTGKPAQIHSRKQHKEFLARNGYVEVGNDFGTPKKRDDGPADAPMLSVDELKKQGFVEEAL